MEDYSRIPIGRTVRILRGSVYTFLQKYQSFTTTAAVLALPYAALVLLSESAIPSSALLQGIHMRLQSLFDAAGFPRSSDFFAILSVKLSQTIATSYLVFPFIFTFFLFAKAFVIHTLSDHDKAVSPTPFTFFNSHFGHLFYTQLCNMITMISANATCFCILFFAFNCIDGLGLLNPKTLLVFSATGAVLYSIVLANTLIICNLALIVSGMEKSSGYMAILKACVLIRGRTATALSLALPVNLALAATEALFQYRIVRTIHQQESPFSSIVFEGLFIAYLYAILIVLDTVIGCIFYKSCRSTTSIEFEAEQIYQIEFESKDANVLSQWKTLETLP